MKDIPEKYIEELNSVLKDSRFVFSAFLLKNGMPHFIFSGTASPIEVVKLLIFSCYQFIEGKFMTESSHEDSRGYL
jgi:hypothetical protein